MPNDESAPIQRGPCEPGHPPLARALIQPLTRARYIKKVLCILAAVALVAGFLVGPRLMRFTCEPPGSATMHKLEKIVFAAYPTWAAEHAGQGCPTSLADIVPYMNSDDVNDAWGRPLTLLCDSTRSGFNVIAIISNGPDGRARTGDDLMAWQ